MTAPHAPSRAYRFVYADAGKEAEVHEGTLKLEGSWAMIYTPGIGTTYAVPADSVEDIEMVE